MSKTYIVQLVIKETGTNNRVKLKAKRLSQNAVDDIEGVFVRQMVLDPSHLAREEMLEALDDARQQLNNEAPDLVDSTSAVANTTAKSEQAQAIERNQ